MKVLVTGGTGFVGSEVVRAFLTAGDDVTVMTRRDPGSKDTARGKGPSYLIGDPVKEGEWQDRLGDHEVIINLAGASIFRRWNKDARKAIVESRVQTTQNLVTGLIRGEKKPSVLLSASAVGHYGFHGDEDLDETSPAGQDFLASVTRAWEESALGAEKAGVRVVLCRLGVVMGVGGGALAKMVPLFQKGLGSPIGSGKQWVSWIHLKDLTSAFRFLALEKTLSGPVNCTAPHPVTNRQMSRLLGEVLHRPVILPAVPAMAIKLSMGEFGTTVLEGQRVLPKRLLASGFSFQFPELKGALENLLKRDGGGEEAG